MLKLGVLVSGGGTNLQAIIDRIGDGYLAGCEIAVVVSGNCNAFALRRAEKHMIPATCVQKKLFAGQTEFDNALISCFNKYDIDLVVMAGYLSMVGEVFVNAFKNRVINIHPSLIPAFCGKGYYGLIPHMKALEYGVKVTGATVHFVDYEYDNGPIILQKAVAVYDNDTPQKLQLRVMEQAEWLILPEAIRLFADGRLVIDGRKVGLKNRSPES
jgi:phosphoribosylglycinamide formyltransferase 1